MAAGKQKGDTQMSRITQLLGCAAFASAVALAPAAMARGGGAGAAIAKSPAAMSAGSAVRGPRVDPVSGPASRVAPMMKPLEPRMFPGPAVARLWHTGTTRPHLYPRAVPASPMSHAQLARHVSTAQLAGPRPRMDNPNQFPRVTLARLHNAKLAHHSHERLGRLIYRPGSSRAAD